MSSIYLERYAYPQSLTNDTPHPNLKISVVIPCFHETGLLQSLESLKECEKPLCAVEIIVIINEPENCGESVSKRNEQTYEQAVEWATSNSRPDFKFLIFYLNKLARKHAGVGLARKIGMDEAVRRFSRIKDLPPQDAILACFDADSLCEPNYLVELERHFSEDKKTPGCSIYYEHPLSGSLPDRVYEGIVKYELYLRYYVHALRYAGFPYAFQTIGSSMAVRVEAYVKQGGMNRKKAGEDFYFLHKIIPLGNFSELNSTTVIPSPRVSDRVPFGTGKAIGNWVSETPVFYPAYHPATFIALKDFLDHMNDLWLLSLSKVETWLKQRSPVIRAFLAKHNFEAEILRIKESSVAPEGFYKKFFEWLNAFMVLKFVHFSRDYYFKDIPVEEAATWLLNEYYAYDLVDTSDRKLLQFFRELDKKQRKKLQILSIRKS